MHLREGAANDVEASLVSGNFSLIKRSAEDEKQTNSPVTQNTICCIPIF